MRKKFDKETEYSLNQVMELLMQMAQMMEAQTKFLQQTDDTVTYLADMVESGGSISEQLTNFIPDGN